VIHIIGGGTFSHVRNHLALAAPAFGATAKRILQMLRREIDPEGKVSNDAFDIRVHLTKMADSASKIVTNDDVAALIDQLVADPKTSVIILNAALCDYDGQILRQPVGGEHFEEFSEPLMVGTESGKYEERLKTSQGPQVMALRPADKVIGRIRMERKDIFAVGFKTTTGATPDEQYRAGLELLKRNSLNLVLANDTVTRNNMIIAPEETRYHETDDRDEILKGLAGMVMARKDNTFTRSTVIDGELVSWDESPLIPDNLREVVNHCVRRGAYKPVLGKTAGHFAARVDEKSVVTSVRKTNFNESLDLVRIDYEGLDKVVAHGAKPSVGGQSQRIIFDSYPDADCIFHAHVPMWETARDIVPVAPQWQNECGSHQCGRNTAENLRDFGHGIRAVMLEGHGPNVVFSRDTPAKEVIDFIESNFNLEAKTGGILA
jgi:hypothetical protein